MKRSLRKLYSLSVLGLLLILSGFPCSIHVFAEGGKGPGGDSLELETLLSEDSADPASRNKGDKRSPVPAALELDEEKPAGKDSSASSSADELQKLLDDEPSSSSSSAKEKAEVAPVTDDIGALESELDKSGGEKPARQARQEAVSELPPKTELTATELSGAPNPITNLEFKNEPGLVRIVVTSQRKPIFKQIQGGMTRQHVFVFENTTVPERLQRAYDTSEFPGSVALFTLLQTPNSQPPKSKLIVQLRGEQAPTVVANDKGLTIDYPLLDNPEFEIVNQRSDDLLNSDNIYAVNQRYRGEVIKRIEIKDAEIADVLRLIAKNSGYSVVVGDEVNGRVGTLSLENIPWDQAFTLLLQSKRLGYVKDGKVLRVGTLQQLRAEREEAASMEAAKKRVDPLKTVLIPISFARVSELTQRARSILGERGSLDADNRTNTMIVKDIASNVERIQKLINALDIPPATVSVTGKLVEVSDSFTKKLGISNLGMTAALSGGGSISQALNLSVGGSAITSITVPSAANLTSQLQLAELTKQGRTLAAPTISVLANQTGVVRQSVSFFIPAGDTSVSGTGVPTVSQSRQVTASLLLSVNPVVAGDGTIFMTVRMNNETPVIQGLSTTIDQREVTTQVLVENGDTAVIGGVFQNSVNISREGVPFLMHIPVIGNFFRAFSDVEARAEILVFLTARVTNAEQSLKRSL